VSAGWAQMSAHALEDIEAAQKTSFSLTSHGLPRRGVVSTEGVRLWSGDSAPLCIDLPL